MSRTTATRLRVTMIVLWVVSVVGFVMIGQQMMERRPTATPVALVTAAETSGAPVLTCHHWLR